MFSKIKYYTILLFLIVNNSILAQETAVLNKINLEHPELIAIKEFYKKGNEQKALKYLLKRYQNKENLYLKVSKKDLHYIKSNYKSEVEKSIKTADEVLAKYFLFRYDWDMEKTNIPHQFKNEIDWTTIPNGDEEWCYMLNRHKYWIDLGKAYLFTGNEKYAKCFVDQVSDWIVKNSLKDELKSLSWRRIEAGIRCENWIKSFEYIKNSKHVTPQFLSKFLSSLYQHGAYINSSFSNFSQTSNWGVLEYQGLFNVALFLNEFKIAPQWQQDAINKLTTCIELQVLEDGSQWEQSPMYHNEVFHCYLNVNFLAQQKNIKLPEILVQKTLAMAYANVKWQKPNFHQPILGDSDDTDLRGLLTFASVLFKDPVLKSRAFKKLDYETLFFTGVNYSETYENMESKFPNFLSVYQQSSGDFFMRTSWEKDATYTSMHLKKLGCGHGHDNLLHFTIFANGQDYLIDGGRYSYVDNKWRELFKSNISHNTLGVDDLPNTIYKDSWLNSYEASSQGVYTKSTTNFEYAEAENVAYKRLEDPVSIKRRLLFLKPNVWLIFDSFSANGNHKYSQYFNFPDKNVEIKNNGLTTTFQDNNLRIQPINKAEITLTNAWRSPEYNLKIENKRAEIYKNETGFSSFISLLYFPNQTNIKFEKTPVYSRSDVLLSDSNVEAVNVYIEDKMYTLLVVHDMPEPATHFFKVNNQFVSGEVVLIQENKVHIIK